MILLDTHILVWFVSSDTRLPARLQEILSERKHEGFAVSIISIWEIALLTSRNRLELYLPIEQWVEKVLQLPYIELYPITPEIAINMTSLPDPFHKDPADRCIVATARALDIPIATIDHRIIEYPHVRNL